MHKSLILDLAGNRICGIMIEFRDDDFDYEAIARGYGSEVALIAKMMATSSVESGRIMHFGAIKIWKDTYAMGKLHMYLDYVNCGGDPLASAKGALLQFETAALLGKTQEGLMAKAKIMFHQ